MKHALPKVRFNLYCNFFWLGRVFAQQQQLDKRRFYNGMSFGQFIHEVESKDFLPFLFRYRSDK